MSNLSSLPSDPLLDLLSPPSGTLLELASPPSDPLLKLPMKPHSNPPFDCDGDCVGVLNGDVINVDPDEDGVVNGVCNDDCLADKYGSTNNC